MTKPEFPGRTRSVREIATEKAEKLLKSAGMMEESEHYRDFLNPLISIYEEEQGIIQLNLLTAECLQAWTAGTMISPDQHMHLRGLAEGFRVFPPGPDMRVLEAFANAAIKAVLKRERSNKAGQRNRANENDRRRREADEKIKKQFATWQRNAKGVLIKNGSALPARERAELFAKYSRYKPRSAQRRRLYRLANAGQLPDPAV